MGDSITATCTVQLNFNVSGCNIEYIYGFKTNTVAAGAGVTLHNFVTISPVNISSAGEYTCTVTVLAGPYCQVNGSGQLSMPRTSDTSDSCYTESAMCVIFYLIIIGVSTLFSVHAFMHTHI